ncbi:MAG: indolepyruvate oxidoreductase subunit beta [Planctomycetota bacterium]
MTVFQHRPANERQHPGGWRIAIAGTGGQGVVTAARVLCDAFVEQGHDVVSSQLHGMAQRGGSVQSAVMIGCGISPVIAGGAADFVLGLEPVETARALPLMSRRTRVFMNTEPIVPFVLAQRHVLEKPGAEYPDIDGLIEQVRAAAGQVHPFDATKLATDAGSPRTLNVLMLGCLLATEALPCTPARFWESVSRIIPAPLVEANTGAFLAGVAFAQKLQVAEARP